MVIKIVLLLQMLVYLIITSQLLFYLVILSDAMKSISLSNFLELRKIVDRLMERRFRFIYYAGLLLTITVVVLCSRNPDSGLFITSCIALVCLIADVMIATKGNVPINKLINQAAPGDLTRDWSTIRIKWLTLINIRGGFIVTGMVSQIIGLLLTANAG